MARLTEEGKNKSALWSELHAVFLAVMEELGNNTSHVHTMLCITLGVMG